MKDKDKHTTIRIESWCKKFCQITNNTEWKKNRNLHTILLLDMIINEHYEEPYNKLAPDGPLPQLQKHIVKSRLSKKFWILSNNILQKSLNSNENKMIEDEKVNENGNDIKKKKEKRQNSVKGEIKGDLQKLVEEQNLFNKNRKSMASFNRRKKFENSARLSETREMKSRLEIPKKAFSAFV